MEETEINRVPERARSVLRQWIEWVNLNVEDFDLSRIEPCEQGVAYRSRTSPCLCLWIDYRSANVKAWLGAQVGACKVRVMVDSGSPGAIPESLTAAIRAICGRQ